MDYSTISKMIILKMPRIPPVDLRLGTGSCGSVESKEEQKFEEVTSYSSPALAPLRASLNSLGNDKSSLPVGDRRTSPRAFETRHRSNPREQGRPSSVPDDRSIRLPTQREVRKKAQSLKINGSAATKELDKVKKQKDEGVRSIGSHKKSPNHPFSFIGQNNNDSSIREENEKEGLSTWGGEDSRHGDCCEVAKGKAGACKVQTLNEHEGPILFEEDELIWPRLPKQFLQNGNMGKAAKVLGVDDEFDQNFSRQKQRRKDIKPKEKKPKAKENGDKMNEKEGQICLKGENQRPRGNETKGKMCEEMKEGEMCSKRRRSRRQRSMSRQWSKVKEAISPIS